jgi:hypothetical protein
MFHTTLMKCRNEDSLGLNNRWVNQQSQLINELNHLYYVISIIEYNNNNYPNNNERLNIEHSKVKNF